MQLALQELPEDFRPVSLEEIGAVSLPHRVETKFLLRESRLPELLRMLAGDYLRLQIGHQHSFRYTTNYFDTGDARLYLDHHNGYLRRMKVRCRRYDATGQCFFEIKQKVNAQRSDKMRFAVAGLMEDILTAEQAAEIHYPRLAAQSLCYSLTSAFRRSSFCDTAFTERMTIDTGITACNDRDARAFPGLALVEIKQNFFSRSSTAMKALQRVGAIHSPFSKYALGKALLHPELKRNNFKPLLSLLTKHSFL